MIDIRGKTLAQLASEHSEKKFVTLDTASTVSGYTVKHIERLCRLKKIAYKLTSANVLAVDLESLLVATQTILLSQQGINFLSREDLHDDPDLAYGLMEKPKERPLDEPPQATNEKMRTFVIVGERVHSPTEEAAQQAISTPNVTPATPSDISTSAESADAELNTAARPITSFTNSFRVRIEQDEKQSLIPTDIAALAKPTTSAVIPEPSRPIALASAAALMQLDAHALSTPPIRSMMVIDRHPLLAHAGFNVVVLLFFVIGTFLGFSGLYRADMSVGGGATSFIGAIAEWFRGEDVIIEEAPPVINTEVVTPVFVDHSTSTIEETLTP